MVVHGGCEALSSGVIASAGSPGASVPVLARVHLVHMRADVVTRHTREWRRHEVSCVGGTRAEEIPGEMWT